MPDLNLFDSINYLEPRCQNCGSKLDLGVNTKYDDKHKTHICLKCKTPIEEIEDRKSLKAKDLEDYAV
jgi:DNA-directed RNA polymerase subunit RPC12/RpoP